jgi:PKD repeat protein
MKKNTFLILSMFAILSVMVLSCSKDTPAPTAEIFATVNGYEVTFNPTVTDVDTYAWDFGDDETSTEAKPVHTYAVSGTYHVTLVVKGGGGEATVTKDITIAASFLEMLTGGEAAANGKTWVMSTAYTAGSDGGGPITPEMPLTIPSAENVLAMFGLEAEYDNEFTFYSNGHYKMDLKNGVALAGAVYGVVMGTIQGEPAYDIGMCAATLNEVPSNATWELNETDLTVDAITDPNTTDIPPVHSEVTFTGKKWISLSTGAYFGILDFPTTAKFIVKEITPTKMNVALFLCGYGYGENPDDMMLPTNFIHITFVPKSAK